MSVNWRKDDSWIENEYGLSLCPGQDDLEDKNVINMEKTPMITLMSYVLQIPSSIFFHTNDFYRTNDCTIIDAITTLTINAFQLVEDIATDNQTQSNLMSLHKNCLNLNKFGLIVVYSCCYNVLYYLL